MSGKCSPHINSLGTQMLDHHQTSNLPWKQILLKSRIDLNNYLIEGLFVEAQVWHLRL